MKYFSMIIVFLTVLGCGKSADTEPQTQTATPAIQRDITFEASRGYNPSSWSNYTEEIVLDSRARVPIELIVTNNGNSGTGWASISTEDRKFCYQGNASNNNTSNGDKFVLVKEKTLLTEECFQANNDAVYDSVIDLKSGQIINVSVHGGGCSNSRGTCLNTTVKGSIEIIE